MARSISQSDLNDVLKGLKWLTGFRSLFASVLLFSTFVFCMGEDLPHTTQPFISLYGVGGLLLGLSAVYWMVLPLLKKTVIVFAYMQLMIDSFLITVIVFITGSFSSIFTFLYLVCIIGASMLLLRKGSMVIAACCSIQYGILVDLEYYGVFTIFGSQESLSESVEWFHIISRIVIIMVACFAVAFLSGYLALQAKRARRDLRLIEGHLKRVERLAAMGEIAAGMAHEIKNPLASLSGSIQMLQDNTEPGTPNHRLMQIVIRETERLSRIVTDFLLFARPQTGNAINLRVDKAIEDVVVLFKQDSIYAGRIEVVTDKLMPVWISMDPGHFTQVMWNLLKNAAESIDTSGTIRIAAAINKSDQVRLTIADNGSGILEGDMDSIFNPFYTTKPNGTGLGLSIIHRIIDSYNGLIDVESERGKGSVFTIILNQAEPQ